MLIRALGNSNTTRHKPAVPSRSFLPEAEQLGGMKPAIMFALPTLTQSLEQVSFRKRQDVLKNVTLIESNEHEQRSFPLISL